MSIRERATIILAAFFAAVGLPVGVAVYRTWTEAHTTAGLTGFLLVAGIACMAMSQAFGVGLHDRRKQAGPPTIHDGAPGPGSVQGMDPVSLARMHDLYSRVQHREHQRCLADFGMDAGRVQDAETGQFKVADWSEPRPAAGMGWDD